MNTIGTRFVVAFVLHMMIIPELRVALQMYKYLRRVTPDDITRANHSRLLEIAFMKFTSAAVCEWVNVWIICQSETNQDIIKDFVCLGFIIEIDDIYAKAILAQSELSLISDF